VASSEEDAAETLDLRGLKCPLPAVFARRALELAQKGTLFEVLADDPMAIIDVPHMCAQEGFEVLTAEKTGASSRFLLKRKD